MKSLMVFDLDEATTVVEAVVAREGGARG